MVQEVQRSWDYRVFLRCYLYIGNRLIDARIACNISNELFQINCYTPFFREEEVYSKDRVLVGTADGRIGLLILQGNKTLRITWLLTSTGSGITSLDTHQLQDGIDILVGRQDGVVEVYTFPDEDVTSILRYHYVSHCDLSFHQIESD